MKGLSKLLCVAVAVRKSGVVVVAEPTIGHGGEHHNPDANFGFKVPDLARTGGGSEDRDFEASFSATRSLQAPRPP